MEVWVLRSRTLLPLGVSSLSGLMPFDKPIMLASALGARTELPREHEIIDHTLDEACAPLRQRRHVARVRPAVPRAWHLQAGADPTWDVFLLHFIANLINCFLGMCIHL